MHKTVQSGTTLIEILVAILVISIGMLGIAGMQALGLRNNHTASMRSQATMMAYDLADRVRANPGGAANFNYNFDAESDLPTAAIAACETSAGCTNAQMANHDTYDWLQTLTRTLPDGKGTICLDSTPVPIGNPSASASAYACDGLGSVYAIKVWWDEDKTGVAADYKGFVTTFIP